MDTPIQKEQALFEEAQQLTSPEQRRSFLQRACTGDVALRQRVEELLSAAGDADQFFDSGAAALERPVFRTELGRERIGDLIGRYRLREQIGEGGCGVVYVAEQEEPVRRKVALKIIKLGMDTQTVVARFDAERQALAMMDHPSIAKVLDGGATATGRPFFVMELVRGTRITEFCDRNELSTGERLELFVKVCQAVQHAHQKGVIHRDLKPSNILVMLHDGVPVPKIIDFGIAKAMDGRLTELTVYTELHQFMGTPAYMSPEQAGMSGVDVDTRSDIYSLGVLLYELLTGTTPFESKELFQAGVEEMRLILGQKEPVRPSTKLSTMRAEDLTITSNRRRTEAPKLISLLRGDLDWIVMKCLEKDRARRYATANGLATDIKRYANHEPVVARPPSRLYQLQKSFERNRITFTAAACVVIALLAATVVSRREVTLAQQARHRQEELDSKAENEAARARAAEAVTQEKLWSSYLTEAVALRASREAGRRFEALDRVQKAAALHPSLELRNAAIATFALADLHLARELEKPRDRCFMNPDFACRRYVFPDEDSAEGNVYLRSIEDNRELAVLPGPGARVVWAQFSPDDRLLAVQYAPAENRSDLRIWDVAKRQVVCHRESEESYLLSFTADSRRAVLCSPRQPVSIYDLRMEKVLQSFDLSSTLQAMAAHPREETLAIIRKDASEVELLDLRTGEVRKSFPHPALPRNCLWSQDGSLLACSCNDSRIYLWDTIAGRIQATLVGHQSLPFPASFSHDGQWLASTGYDGVLRLWDVHTGVEICNRPVFGYNLRFSPDDRWLLAQSSEGKLGVFAFVPGHECRTLRFNGIAGNESWSCSFGPDGRMLVAPDADGLRFWNVETGDLIAFHPIGDTRSVIFDSTGETLLTNGRQGLRRWPVAWRADVTATTLSFGPPADLGWCTDYEPLTSTDPAAKLVAAVCDGQACVFDLESRREMARFPDEGSDQFAVISPKAKWCAAGHWPKPIRIYDLESRRLVTNLPAMTSHALFSSDERWLAVPGYREYIVWDTANWQIAWHIPRTRTGYYIRGVIAFDHDSRLVALSQGPLVQLRDAATGTELATFESPEPAIISALAFRPSADKLAVCKWNHTIDLWDLRQVRSELAQMKLDWDLPANPKF